MIDSAASHGRRGLNAHSKSRRWSDGGSNPLDTFAGLVYSHTAITWRLTSLFAVMCVYALYAGEVNCAPGDSNRSTGLKSNA
jgi:hypothetical protein